MVVKFENQILRASILWCLLVSPLIAELPKPHYRHRADMPPGAIGREQLDRGGPLRNYFQAVEIRAPRGVHFALAVGGKFEEPRPAPINAGMLIGQVYRFQVTRIPNHPGAEVYPTVEVINRLFPPEGEKARFPVQVDLTQEELEWAIDGRFITRVIYLEDPATALPHAEDPDFQRYFEVRADADPLQVADQLGRPMAILRIGGRIPDLGAGPSAQFLFGSPKWVKYDPVPSKLPPAARVGGRLRQR